MLRRKKVVVKVSDIIWNLALYGVSILLFVMLPWYWSIPTVIIWWVIMAVVTVMMVMRQPYNRR